MKFACDQCKTKYTIADERVRGKVLKIRCKSCSHIITVREEGADRPAPVPSDSTVIGTPESLLSDPGGVDAAPFGSKEGGLARPEAEEWHVSVDGVAEGPLKLSALAQRVLSERLSGDREVFVWRDGFEDWLPPQVVAEVSAAMEKRKAAAAKPAPARPPEPPRAPAASGKPSGRSLPPKPPASGRSSSGAPPRPAVAALGGPPPLPAPASKPVAPSGTRPAAGPASKPAPVVALSVETPLPAAKPVLSSLPAPSSPALPASSGPSPSGPSPITELLGGVDAAAAAKDPRPPEKRSPVLDNALSSLPAVPRPPEGNEPDDDRGGFDLAISEPSMVIDLAAMTALKRSLHMEPDAEPAAKPAAKAEPRPAAASEPSEAPAPAQRRDAAPFGSAEGGPGASSPELSAAPVMVVAGPATPPGNRQLKLVLAGAVMLCMVLLGTVVHLLTMQHPQTPPPPVQDRLEPDRSKKIDDRPVIVNTDPGLAATVGDGGAVNKPTVRKTPRPRPAERPMNAAQTGLASLYDPSDRPRETVLPTLQRADNNKPSTMSSEQLGQVVQKNKKSLSNCYERFLKHDESLRSARINVTVKIGLSGRVTHSELSGAAGDTELGRCMQQTIKRWLFPPNDSDYEFQFPLLLTAS